MKKEASKNNRKILIVDDDESIRYILARVLKKEGYIVETAETGEAAVEKSSRQPYDLTLVDLKLPDVDGTALLAKIRSLNSETVIIMLTGYASEQDRRKAMNNGADAYLTKPVKTIELTKLIKQKLQRKVATTEPR